MFEVCMFCVILHCLIQLGVVFCVHLVFLLDKIIHRESKIPVSYAHMVP